MKNCLLTFLIRLTLFRSLSQMLSGVWLAVESGGRHVVRAQRFQIIEFSADFRQTSRTLCYGKAGMSRPSSGLAWSHLVSRLLCEQMPAGDVYAHPPKRFQPRLSFSLLRAQSIAWNRSEGHGCKRLVESILFGAIRMSSPLCSLT